MSRLTSNKPKDWNDQQNDVWKAVETHWEHLLDKRVDEFIEYIHEDMVGFGHESPVSVDKPWLQKWVGFWTKTTDILICELRPIHVIMHSDTLAVLQYLIFTVEKNMEGGKRVIRRYTMTWQKTGAQWQVLASHNNLMEETLRG